MHAPVQPERRHPSLGEIFLLGSLTAFGAITIDLYLPTLPSIGHAFAASPATVQLTLSTFFIGMAIGQLFYGPASDRFGRRPAILFGCAVYVVASLACALAPSIHWLVAGRFVQALGCCAGMVVARAVVRDRYDHADSARIFSLLVLVLAVAPMVAPTVGGWLALAFSWRAIFLVLAGFGLIVGTVVFLRLDESRSLATEAKARGEHPVAGYIDLLGNRRLLGYILVGGLNGATLFAYISSAPDLVISLWGFTTQQFGLVFAFIATGIIGSSQINRRLLNHYGPDAILGVTALLCIMVGGALLAASVLGAPVWVMLGLLFLTMGSNGFIGANAIAGALNVDPLRAGATSGLFGSANFALGAVASALVAAFHDGTARPMAAVMLLSLALAAAAFYGLARPRRIEAA